MQDMHKKKTFIFPDNIEGLEFKGSKPSKGSMTVNKDGKVAMAITNGKYCVTKGFEDDDVTIKEDDGKCKLPGYNLGDIVYYNPNEAKVCTEAEWNDNADKNEKTGCMRWYVYALNGSIPKLILDHNTTNSVAWNESGSNDDYVTLKTQLTADTTNWKVKADIITLEELANLIPYYQNLSPSEKELFLNPTEENTSVIDGYFEYLDTFFEEVCSKPENLAICESGDMYAKVELLASQPNSPMLPTYMFMDMKAVCLNGEECPTYGYWTKTAYALNSNGAWAVYLYGDVVDTVVDDVASGLRPVITLSK